MQIWAKVKAQGRCRKRRGLSSPAIEFLAAIVLLWVAATFHPGSACAQSLEPRAYANIPVGMNFLMLGYGYQWGNVLFDPSVPIQGASAEIHTTFLAYVRSLMCGANPERLMFLLPMPGFRGAQRFKGWSGADMSPALPIRACASQ